MEDIASGASGGGLGCCGLFLIPIIAILVLLGLAVLGPSVGQVYSNITIP